MLASKLRDDDDVVKRKSELLKKGSKNPSKRNSNGSKGSQNPTRNKFFEEDLQIRCEEKKPK